jgi:hypothetical protein
MVAAPVRLTVIDFWNPTMGAVRCRSDELQRLGIHLPDGQWCDIWVPTFWRIGFGNVILWHADGTLTRERDLATLWQRLIAEPARTISRSLLRGAAWLGKRTTPGAPAEDGR